MTEAEFQQRIAELFSSIDVKIEQAEWRACLRRHPATGLPVDRPVQPVRRLFPEAG